MGGVGFLVDVRLFSLLLLTGSAILLGCLGLTRWVFGFTGLLADNVSANRVGLTLGSAPAHASRHSTVDAVPSTPHFDPRSTKPAGSGAVALRPADEPAS